MVFIRERESDSWQNINMSERIGNLHAREKKNKGPIKIDSYMSEGTKVFSADRISESNFRYVSPNPLKSVVYFIYHQA